MRGVGDWPEKRYDMKDFPFLLSLSLSLFPFSLRLFSCLCFSSLVLPGVSAEVLPLSRCFGRVERPLLFHLIVNPL